MFDTGVYDMSSNDVRRSYDEVKGLFFIADRCIANLEVAPEGVESDCRIDGLLRVMGAIKDYSATLGFSQVIEFVGALENVLGQVKSGILTLDDKIISVFVLSKDHLQVLILRSLSLCDIEKDILHRSNILLLDLLSGCLSSNPVSSKDGLIRRHLEKLCSKSTFLLLSLVLMYVAMTWIPHFLSVYLIGATSLD